jgi:hypothetical protein
MACESYYSSPAQGLAFIELLEGKLRRPGATLRVFVPLGPTSLEKDVT